jgi:hypothetical protein
MFQLHFLTLEFDLHVAPPNVCDSVVRLNLIVINYHLGTR